MDGEASAGFQDHVAGCAGCAREEEELRRLRNSVRALPIPPAPPELRVKILRQCRPARGPYLRLTLATAASILLAFLLLPLPSEAGMPELVLRSSSFYDDLLDGKVKWAEQSSPADLRTYFRDRLGLTVAVPKLEGTEIAGGCPCHLDSRSSPWIVYRRGQTLLSLLVFDGPSPDLPEAAKRKQGSIEYFTFRCDENTVITCCRENTTHLWISRLPESEMVSLILATPEGRQALEGSRIPVGQLTCALCCSSAESRATEIEGVSRATYDPKSHELIVEFDEKVVTLDAIRDALRRAGYPPR